MPRQLPDWIDAYCDYTDNTEPPYTYRLWSAISVVSSVLQRKCRFEFGSLTYFPNMYVVLVGPSGRARKGTAMTPALHLLQDIGIHLAAESTTREALIKALSEAQDQNADIETGTMHFHSSLTIFSPELTVFLGYQNHQLLSDLTDWYDCRNKWIYRTKNMGTDKIEGVFVNLFGATTPDLIKTSLPMDAIGGGLTSRIIYVYEENKGKIVPYPAITKREVEIHKKLESDLQLIHMIRGNFTFTGGYLDNWIRWYTMQEENPPFKDNNFNGYMERRPNHVMKLSMIVSASRSDSMIITEHDLARAIRILNLTEAKMPRTFAGVGRSNVSGIVSNVMNEIALQGRITKGELMNTFIRDASEWEMDNILRSILSLGNFADTELVGSELFYVYKGEAYSENPMENFLSEDEGKGGE